MIMATDTTQRPHEPGVFALDPGPRWPSLEQLRKEGAKQLLEKLGPDQVGRLRVRNTEYVIMRTETWNKTYGLARDVSRLQGTLVLVRQAVQLVVHARDEGGITMALDHLRDLAFHLPWLKMEPQPSRELAFPDDREEESETGAAEIDPKRIKRPAFSTSRSEP